MYSLLLFTLMVPVAALVLPLGAMLKTLGWINTYQGLVGPTRRWASRSRLSS